MKFENIRVFNFEGALRGMRNPKNSWHLSDSYFGYSNDYVATPQIDEVALNWTKKWVEEANSKLSLKEKEELFTKALDFIFYNGVKTIDEEHDVFEVNAIGPKDMKLAQALIAGGSEHRKFMRQIFVTMDITAPLYWWKEFDTYKVGTVANSTSTMHTIQNKPITLDCFETDDYCEWLQVFDPPEYDLGVKENVENNINFLETLRLRYLKTKDKRYWKELIRWLPESWLQKRTVTINYENLYCMVRQREFHKQNEWSGKDNPSLTNFINEIRKLPYAKEFIFYGMESN